MDLIKQRIDTSKLTDKINDSKRAYTTLNNERPAPH